MVIGKTGTRRHGGCGPVILFFYVMMTLSTYAVGQMAASTPTTPTPSTPTTPTPASPTTPSPLLGVQIATQEQRFVAIPLLNSDGHLPVTLEIESLSVENECDQGLAQLRIGQRYIQPSATCSQRTIRQSFAVEKTELAEPGTVGGAAIYVSVRSQTSHEYSVWLTYGSYSPFPVYSLATSGTEYNVITYCQILGSCFVAVTLDGVSVSSSTVTVILPADRHINVTFEGVLYLKGEEFTFQIASPQVAVLECHRCDLTGTIIKSNFFGLVVYSGGKNTIVSSGIVPTAFVAQMFPVSMWGRRFFAYGSSSNEIGDIVRVVSRYNATIVKMDKYLTSRLNASAQFIQRALYPGEITHISSDKPIMIAQIISDGAGKSSMSIVPSTDHYFNTNFVIRRNNTLGTGASLIYPTNTPRDEDIPIGLSGYYFIKLGTQNCEGMADGTIIAVNSSKVDVQYFSRPVLKEVVVTKPMVPGDREDNDNDGLIDEDSCGYQQYFSGFEIGPSANFSDAAAKCKASGSELVIANTPEKYKIMIEYIKFKESEIFEEYLFIGGQRQPDGTFKWLDGSDVPTHQWDSGQPNTNTEQSLAVNKRSRLLHDYPSYSRYTNAYYLCANWSRVTMAGYDCDSILSELEQDDTTGSSFLAPVNLLSRFTRFTIKVLSGNGRPAISRVEVYNGSMGNQTVTQHYQKELTEAVYSTDSLVDCTNVVLVTSYPETSVQVIIEDTEHMVSTILFPNEVLGLEYFAATYCRGTCTTYCVVTSIHDSTSVKVIFPNSNFNASIIGVDFQHTFIQKASVHYSLDQYTFIRVESAQDLTGTYIKADNSILVICGAEFNQHAIMEQTLPTKFYQQGPFTTFESTNDNKETLTRIMASNLLTGCKAIMTISNMLIEQLLFIENYGDFVEIHSDSYEQLNEITCDKPVMIWIVVLFHTAGNMAITLPDGQIGWWIHEFSDDLSNVWSTESEVQFIEQTICDIGNVEDPDCDGLSKEDLCVLKGYNFPPRKYLLEAGRYIYDFDLDGNHDEDCSHTIPDCYMPTIANGSVSLNDGDVKTHVTSRLQYTCAPDHTPYPKNVITCYANGSWYPQPQCLPDCLDPMLIYTGSVVPVGEPWSVGSNVTMECIDGHSLNGNPVLRCNESSEWTQNAFSCLPDCPDPKLTYNGSVIAVGDSWSVGSNVTMRCIDGLYMNGNPVLRCNEGSEWTKNAFTCQPGCTEAYQLVSNSIMRYPDEPRPINSTHELICNGSYSVRGHAFATCNENLTWTGHDFDCVQSCNDPRLISQYAYIPGFTDGTPFIEGLTVHIQCRAGSTLVGTGIITCLTGKKWTSTPKCIPDCPDPRLVFDIPFAYLKRFNSESSLAYGSTYEFRCNLFYAMYGDGRIRCQEDSKWTNVNITCKSCKCLCRKRGNPRYDNITVEDESKIKEETKEELQVKKSDISAVVRTKISAKDERPSAQNVGYIGAILLGFIVGGIILYDLTRCFKFFKRQKSTKDQRDY